MKNYKRRILCAIITVLTLIPLLTLTSCNRRYDESEVIEATKKLLKDAEMLNKVYYGSGIKYYDDNEEKGYYRKADSSHLDELGFSTIEELKALTEQTFSNEYSNLLYSTILSPIMTDTAVAKAARYYQAYDEKTKLPSHIMVYSKFTPMMKDQIEYDFDSITVNGAKKEKVYVSVDAIVTSVDGKSQRVTLTVMLVEGEDGWRIDNPTYANYNESKDRYDELKDQEIR